MEEEEKQEIRRRKIAENIRNGVAGHCSDYDERKIREKKR